LPRGFDHIVHAVHDLDAAGELYQSFGFTVGARNKHPWGTHNRIVQLDGAYIELLMVAEPEKIVPHGPRSFSFGAFHRDALLRGQGLNMLLLHADDAKADADEFCSAGIGDFDVFHFERQGQKPDGAVVKLAFSLVFAADPNAPNVGFGACQHFFPENFWNKAFQHHANGAKRIAGVVMVANEPARHREFFKAYTGADNIRDSGEGFAIDLPNGAIDMMTPAAFDRSYGQPAPDTSRGARIAAMRFSGGKPDVKAAMGAVLIFDR
jgi:Glyoxalase-like domain